MIIPNIWKNKKCSKPPTRDLELLRQNASKSTQSAIERKTVEQEYPLTLRKNRSWILARNWRGKRAPTGHVHMCLMSNKQPRLQGSPSICLPSYQVFIFFCSTKPLPTHAKPNSDTAAALALYHEGASTITPGIKKVTRNLWWLENCVQFPYLSIV